jgi:CubicO group peptidase (beta-lactamase class C family)
MRIGLFVTLALFSAVPCSPRPAFADDAAVTAQLQQILDDYVKERGPIEGLSGAGLQVDRGVGHPILAVYAGDNGLNDRRPIGPDTLFDIGSNTKEFTSSLILKLEAAGKLKLDDTIGRWLPQYPAWKDVTIRSLLQMVSDIPNYSETVEIGEIEVADIHHQFSDKDLIGFVDPGNGKHFPPAKGWFYSNTNYILAGLIIEAASGMNYEQALTTMILEPLGLHDRSTPTDRIRGLRPPARSCRVCLARSTCCRIASCIRSSTAPYRRSRPSSARTCGCRTARGPQRRGPSSRTRATSAYGFAPSSRSGLSGKAARGDDDAGLEQDRPASFRGLRR